MEIFDVPGVRISTSPLDRAAAARDLWPGGTLDLWQGRPAPEPDCVAWPEDEAQVLAVLERARAEGRPVVPYGAGSGVCGGARGKAGSVVLDTKAMDRIGPLDRERWTVEAEPGVNGQHLEDFLAARGFTLGHSPSSIWCSTVGGWAAARGAGQFSSRYGVFEDMVLQLRAVAPGVGAFCVGEEGDAPAEWMPMLLGSEGTLAVLTRVRMRVWPAPKTRWLRGYAFPDLESAVRAQRELMQAELWPAVLRLYDPVDTRIGGRTKPKRASEGSKRSRAVEWLRALAQTGPLEGRALALPLALPGLVNHLLEGMASGCLLIVAWEGEPEVVDALVAAGRPILESEGQDLGAEPGERWLHSRHAVSYKLAPIFENGGFADTMEVAARWSRIVPLYNAIRSAISETAVVMAHMSHAYPEGGSIYFSFAGRGDRAVYDATWRSALRACLDAGGTVTHHHGVGSLKARAATEEVGPAVAGWRDLRAELGAEGLNPGRLFERVDDDAPLAEPSVSPSLEPEDGLARIAFAPGQDVLLAGVEALWPWEHLPALPRWQRLPWQTGWSEVEGEIDGRLCRLGRGPRSAAGPDLRLWLFGRAVGGSLTVPVASEGARWMGEAEVDRPWWWARELLRGDLRPACLTVVEGRLRVGFRGPAAEALGALASAKLPSTLEPVAWEPVALPAGPLVRCEPDDARVVWVTASDAYRRETTNG